MLEEKASIHVFMFSHITGYVEEYYYKYKLINILDSRMSVGIRI